MTIMIMRRVKYLADKYKQDRKSLSDAEIQFLVEMDEYAGATGGDISDVIDEQGGFIELG